MRRALNRTWNSLILIAVKHRLLLFFLLVLSNSAFAQLAMIYGTLTDSATGQPIPYANVLVKGTLNGKQTDENGSFVIRTENLPATLVFVCMGYRTREVTVTQTNKVLAVHLAPAAQQLNEVVITGERVQCIQKDLSLMASDFEFFDNYLVVLAYRDAVSPARLMLLDEYGQNVHTLYVSSKMENLYRDCFGRVHLMSKDSSWQVYFDYEKLQLIYPVTRTEMLQTFNGVDLFFAGRLFTRMYTHHNQRCDFLCAYKGNNISFHRSADTSGINRIALNYDINYFLRMRRQQRGYNYSADYMKTHLAELQEQVRLSPKDSFALRAVNAKVIQHNMSVWIFDFTNDKAYRFDERLMKTDSVALHFHHDAGWTGELLRDESTDHLYTTYVRNGQLHICRLHDKTFDVVSETVIEDKPFPVEVKIRSNIVYFLWMDRREAFSNRMLYRLVI